MSGARATMDDAGSIARDLPTGAVATAPAERRGLARDEVRMLVARPDGLRDATARDLADALEPGDLVVVNRSQTRPSALDGVDGAGHPVRVHVGVPRDDGAWVVEVRRPRGFTSAPDLARRAGDRLRLPGGATVTLSAPADDRPDATRYWVAALDLPIGVATYLDVHAHPIAYDHLEAPPSLDDLRTHVGRVPGSAEMPSAGRPVTARVLAALARRVVAVGTTVVRALETEVVDGAPRARAGTTRRVVTPQDPPVLVTGLLTGWHAPRASHLRLLEAVAGRTLVAASYAYAARHGYRWHEFGDVHLLLPGPAGA